jgi:parvulin-like peptidyl-prolyl isomerase
MIKVNGTEIPQAAVDFELKRLIQFYAQHLPEAQVRKQLDALRERAKEQAVGAKLLLDEAKRLDIPVSDEEVEARIAELMQQAGGEARFREMLAKADSNRVQFAEQVRRGRRVDKLIERIAADVRDPTEDELRAHYEAHREEYTKAEQAQAQHILVRPSEDSDAGRRAALDKLNGLRAQIEDGADFAQVAAAHSDCPSGRQAGGSLGWFGRGAMVPAFDAAVFSMDVGALSPAIETSFGFHLIQKTGHEPSQTPDYEEVRESVRDFLRHARRGEAVSARVAELRAKAVIEES